MTDFRLIDTYRNQYFWDGYTFQNKQEALNALREFHSVDVDNIEEYSLEEICIDFHWEIEPVPDKQKFNHSWKELEAELYRNNLIDCTDN